MIGNFRYPFFRMFLFTLLMNVFIFDRVASYRIGSFNQTYVNRRGGYQKFPQAILSSNGVNIFYAAQKYTNTCGTRSINFNPKRTAKIIGGQSAPYGAFPWQVEIQIYNYEIGIYEHHCGGAVIGERIVMTAAHCTEISQQPYLHLVIGNHDLKKFDMYERRFHIEAIIMHPEYRRNGPYSNDISIVKVASNNDAGILFNTHIKPICLPHNENLPSECYISGWGAQNEDNKSMAAVLRAAAVPLLDLETCRMSDVNGGRSQSILDTMICAGLLQGGVDACNGDSGGPLACEHNNKFFLVGIVSWGSGCAKKNKPGVYTRVSAYVDWIKETMNQLNAY
ncbi:serine protease 30-like [Contarinia nasturtii]|uniref:serine protease 30-like n=1 Tax=Contarinia nasturtii TaxID=265458 RepID=UPI0012D38950|nr:serine protease 30-like [Contarinia nasturtii]